MKKLFTISLAAIAAMSASAAAPALYGKMMPELKTIDVSSNGRWVGSQYDGVVVVRTADGAKSWSYEGEKVELGLGNAIANNGFAVGSSMDQAVYYLNGEMYDLIPEEPMLDNDGKPMLDDKGNPLTSNPYAIGNNSANAITPDGTRIVGYVPNLKNEKGTDGTMVVPCFWDVDADGKIGKTTLLPRPLTDWTGRSPQYVTATHISADGKIICGQVQDNMGAVAQPIIYQQNADGEWEYSLPASSLINPNHLVFPEDPGDGPTQPDPKDYMNADQKAEYEAAYEAWTETFDPDMYPVATDYMDADKASEYQAAEDKYLEENAEYLDKYTAFETVLYEAIDASVIMDYNSDVFSSDGKTVAMAAIQPEDWEAGIPEMVYPLVIDLENNDIKKYPADLDAEVSTLADNGDMIVVKLANMFAGTPSQSYIIKKGSEEKVRLDEYFKTAQPEFYDFMKENLVHPFTTMVEDAEGGWDEVTDDEYMFTGAVVANPAMTVYVGSCESYMWTTEEEAYPDYTSYVLETAGTLSVEGIMANAAKVNVEVKALAGGALMVEGTADLVVYDLSGRVLFTANGVNGTVNAGLAAGTYVVKATTADGSRAFKLAL